ncbi:hypothetical protein B0H17DRAFT_943362, partial [Mycena rosella]
VPRKSHFFLLNNRKSKPTPKQMYNAHFFYWDPDLLLEDGVKCPDCLQKLERHGYTRPRRVDDLHDCFYLVGSRHKCTRCTNPKSGKTTITFNSWDTEIMQSLPPALLDDFPAYLSHRGAMSKSVFELMRSGFQYGLGSKQFSNSLQALHRLHYDKLHAQYLDGPTAIIQVAYKKSVYVFQIGHFKGVDLARLAKNSGVISDARMGLSDLCARVLGEKLEKPSHLQISQEWDNMNLSAEQLEYAALDALASLAIYTRLMQAQPAGKTSDTTLPGALVSVHNADSHLIAHGIISSNISPLLGASPVTKTRVRITISNVLVPAALVPLHNKQVLGSFGPAPFDLVWTRSHVWTWAPDSPDEGNRHPTISEQGFRLSFGIALRDAILIPVTEDKERIDKFLRTKNSSWDKELQFNARWLWKRCRRVHPPKQLYDAVSRVYQLYGPQKDAKTKLPLFNAKAWHDAKNVLKAIHLGPLSDPPGVQLYFQMGLDKKNGNLPILRCTRGTKNPEGAVHNSLHARMPKSGVGIRHAASRVTDYVFIHNLVVGTLNRSGKMYKGHYNVEVLNRLQLLLEKARHLVLNAPIMKGWVNGELYTPGNERIGILPVPESSRNTGEIISYNDSTDSKFKHAYLAKQQGTKYAVITVHSVEEKLHFSELMKKLPAFNRPNDQPPDWKQGSRDWNREADGATIFYKVF